MLTLEIDEEKGTIYLSTNNRHLILQGIEFMAKEYYRLETRDQMERTILDIDFMKADK